MSFEKDGEFSPEIDVNVEDGKVFIDSEEITDTIRCVYSYDDGIPIEDVEKVIELLTEKLMEIEDTAHHEYYGELQDARAILLSRDIPRRVEGFEHIISEYEERIKNDDKFTMHGLRCSVIEGIASTEDPNEATVRSEAENYIDSITEFVNEKL